MCNKAGGKEGSAGDHGEGSARGSQAEGKGGISFHKYFQPKDLARGS